MTAQDGIDIALICLPLAALLTGIGVGVVFTRWGFFMQFRLHLDKHFFSSLPDASCPFCAEERGQGSERVA